MADLKAQCADKCKPKCEPNCCKPCCADIKCDSYSPYEVCCKWRAASVRVTGQLAVVDGGATGSLPPTTPTSAADVEYYSVQGDGALISRHLIVTHALHAIVPPSVLANYVKYPFNNGALTPGGEIPNEVTAMSKILVTIRNFNGRATPIRNKCKKEERFDGYTLTFEATLLLVDGAAGVAYLYINPCNEWNKCHPRLRKCHPKFCVGESRKLHCGDPAYILGTLVAGRGNIPQTGLGPLPGSLSQSSGFGISAGVVSNRRAADAAGWALPELVIVDNVKYAPSLGAPIINRFGQLVAVQAGAVPGLIPGVLSMPQPAQFGQGLVGGISQFFFNDSLAAALMLVNRGGERGCARHYLMDHLQSVTSNPNNFYKWVKGFAGIAYELIQPQDFNTFLYNGATGERRLLLNTAGTGLYNGPSYKMLAGVRVENLAVGEGNALQTGGTNPLTVSYVRTPGLGATTPFTGSVAADSNFSPAVLPEDHLVVVAGKCYLGDEATQIPPAVITWKRLPDDQLSFYFRRPELDYATGIVADGNLNTDQSVTAKLVEFPALYDYPWYAVGSFPVTANPLVGGSSLPVANFKPCV